MHDDKNISIRVIKRLPKYYRILSSLQNDGIKKISSTELSRIFGSTASQVRQDLNCFGEFGHQGLGYDVSHLKDEIGSILGIQNHYKAILIGAGNLGRAVATRLNFDMLGFTINAVFDTDERIIGSMIRGLTVQDDNDLEEYILNNEVDVAFLCIPEHSAPTAVDRLYRAGIRNFWNFTYYDIDKIYENTTVEHIHLTDSLMTLCYNMSKKN